MQEVNVSPISTSPLGQTAVCMCHEDCNTNSLFRINHNLVHYIMIQHLIQFIHHDHTLICITKLNIPS